MSSGTVSRAGRKTGRAKSGGISGGAGNSDRVANRWSVTESAEPSEADGPMWAEGELPRRGKRSRPGASAPTGTRPEPRQFRPAAVCGGPAQASTAQTLSGSAGNQPGAVRRSIDARRPMRAATAFRSCRHRTTYRRPAPRGPGPQPGGFSPLFAGEKGPAGGMTSPQSQANNVEAAPARRTQSVTAGAEPSEAGGPMWQKVNCPRGAREAALGHRPLRGCVDRGRGTFGRPGGKMKIHEDFISHPGGTMV